MKCNYLRNKIALIVVQVILKGNYIIIGSYLLEIELLNGSFAEIALYNLWV